MARNIDLKKGEMTLKDGEIDGFLERVVTSFGTSAKADVAKIHWKACLCDNY